MSRPGANDESDLGREGVLARAVRILAVFRVDRTELGVSDIARLSHLHVATTSRLVRQLVDLGLLARTTTGRVRIGLRLWELGQRASPTLTLRGAALPYLTALHAAIGQHVQLGVLDGQDVIFLERLSAPGAVINYTTIAGRLPLHASATGLVLLAHGPLELQEHILSSTLRSFTPATLTDPNTLRSLLAAIRHDGWVAVRGHLHPTVTGIAVPVRDQGTGHVVAAVSTTQPIDAAVEPFAPALRAAAHGISLAYAAAP